MVDCVYLLEEQEGKQTEDGRQVYGCRIHDICVQTGEPILLASCDKCKDRLDPNSKRFASKFVDHLFVTDRDKCPTHALRNLLAGQPSFLVCGGPSAKDLPLYQLEQRGIWTLSVNNMAGYFRARSFICSDPPSKFHNGIWQDPNVWKFVPTPKLTNRRRGYLRKKVGSRFYPLLDDEGAQITTCDCPNVWAYGRRGWIKPDDSFFLEDHAAWGNHDAGVDRTGLEKTVCTMLLGIRLLYYLGSRRIYLVGVDFFMDSKLDLKDNYVFPQDRDEKAINSNNNQFEVVNGWLCQMQGDGVFTKFGLDIFNCNPQSGLRAFDHVPFDLAIQDTLKNFPDEPFDLDGWYDK